MAQKKKKKAARKKRIGKKAAKAPVQQGPKMVELRLEIGFAARLLKHCSMADPTGVYDGENMADLKSQLERQLSPGD